MKRSKSKTYTFCGLVGKISWPKKRKTKNKKNKNKCNNMIKFTKKRILKKQKQKRK